MRLLFTGASGFIGGHLVNGAVARHGPENVIALSSRENESCETIVYRREDFSVSSTDHARLEGIDVVVHAGAFTPKSGSEANSVAGCNSNIAFSDHLLRLPFKKLRKIVYLSTLDVYPPAGRITESTPTIPATLYGQSKLYCERMIAAFAAEASIARQILRLGHVYGPGEEKYSKFVPAAIQNIIAGEPVELWGNGSERRSPIYIDDAVEAILNAVTLEAQPGPINLAGGTAVSIRQLLDHLIAISGKQVEVITRNTDTAARDVILDNRLCRLHLLPEETDLITGLRAEYGHAESLG